MKKLILIAASGMMLMVSCNKEVKTQLTKEEIEKRIDSISSIKLMEVEEQAKKELEYRIKIEVKIKADSIREAMKNK